MNSHSIQAIAELFKAISDTNRLKLLKLLQQKERCVCALTKAMDMRQSHVSFHLGVLKKAEFITSRKCGKWQYYSLNQNDIFLRFLILSVLERIPEEEMAEEFQRLNEFIIQQDETNNGGKRCPV